MAPAQLSAPWLLCSSPKQRNVHSPGMAWPSVPAAIHSKNAQIPATLRGLKADIPDLLGINALADRGWKANYHHHYLKHTL